MAAASAPFTPLAPPAHDTLAKLLLGAVDRYGDAPALMARVEGAWRATSYREALERVERLAAALHDMGVERGDRVALLSESRAEWIIADFAILALGAVTVPIYPTLPAEQVAYILRDAGARAVLASSEAQLAKLAADPAAAPAHRIVFDDASPASAADGATPLRAILSRPAPGGWGARLRERALAVAPDDLATIIYTSGTTGEPKGVMLSHLNLAAMVAATVQHGSIRLSPGEVALSILPLSHVFERAGTLLFWNGGVTIAHAESMQLAASNIAEVRPHHMIAVPRLFEKIHQAVVGAPGVKGRIARWAARVARETVEARTHGRRLGPAPAARQAVADRLVFAKLRARLGGRIRTFICGGAPLAPDVAALFLAAGMPVYEGYGLTETSPVLAANRPGAIRLGSVGLPYPGVELRIGAEGEILARGPSVTRGYWNRPDATAAAIDADGWFHTGDVGRIDDDGFLHITDRLKDLIVTAGGKNIAPQPIELLVAASPLVAQAIMLGDRRPFPVMLLVPDFDALLRWAAAHGVAARDRAALAASDAVRALLEREAAGRLTAVASFERPKRYAVIAEELTVEAGLLTPSLKVRRRAVERRFRAAIESLYRGS